MIETVFEDDHVSIFFSGKGSDVAVLSYSPMNHNFNEKGIPALAALRGAGLDVFGIIARSNNWYPRASMVAAAAALKGSLRKYSRRIGYGSSMGAYGALKSSTLLDCDCVLALAPQYSIDPALVSSWDRRFTRHFDVDLHDGMEISKSDLTGTVFLVVDPAMAADLRHVSLIASAATESVRVEHVHAWYCGHTVINPIASRVTLERIFCAIINDEYGSVHKIYRQARKSSGYYRAALLEAFASYRMSQGRLDVALKAASASIAAFDKLAKFRMTKSLIHMHRAEYSDAYADALRAVEIEPQNLAARQLAADVSKKYNK